MPLSTPQAKIMGRRSSPSSVASGWSAPGLLSSRKAQPEVLADPKSNERDLNSSYAYSAEGKNTNMTYHMGARATIIRTTACTRLSGMTFGEHDGGEWRQLQCGEPVAGDDL